MLFDFATEQWRRSYGPVLGDVVNWARDSKYVYVYGLRGDHPLIFRVSVTTGGMEEVADLKGLESPGQEAFQWFGLAPDNSPIISRELPRTKSFRSVIKCLEPCAMAWPSGPRRCSAVL